MKAINNYYLRALCLLWLSAAATGCGKEFLSAKPDQALLVPKSLDDFQAIMNNAVVMNYSPGLPLISTDEFHIGAGAGLSALPSVQKNAYLWQADIFEGASSQDWNLPYQQVFYSNVVLEGLEKLVPAAGQKTQWDRLKGSALFFRSLAYYQLVSQFARPYGPGSQTDPGIPLKGSSDVNEKVQRGNVKLVYSRIVEDLKASVPLLEQMPAPTLLTRPSRLAAMALLARVCLSMGDYAGAGDYADSCLKLKSSLLDFNSLSAGASRPISFTAAGGSEVIFWHWMLSYQFGSSLAVGAQQELLQSYAANDLRRQVYFRDRGNGIFTFKASYTGDSYLFTGLAVDELYLIRAESRARSSDVAGALADLETLMRRRYAKASFVPSVAASAEEALKLVLSERRKELFARGTRWTDLRRLNQEPGFEVELSREMGGERYRLEPGSDRYVFPIPLNEIWSSGIAQNER